MAPQLAKLAKAHGDKVVVLKVNAQHQGGMAQKAGVRSIPDTRLLYNGRELVRKVGGMGYRELEQMVLRNASKLPPVVAGESAEGMPLNTLGRRPSTGPKLPGGIVRQAPTPTPEAAEAKKDSIVPMKDDWLPPGVTRQ